MPEKLPPVVVGTFESTSYKEMFYTVLKHEDGSLTCDCPAFTHFPPGFGPICSHIRRVRNAANK